MKPALSYAVHQIPEPYRANLMGSRLMRSLRSLPVQTGPTGPWVAGGAVRRALLGTEHEATAGADIDLFFHTPLQFEEWKRAMASVPGARIIVTKDHCIEFEFGDCNLQGIKGRYFQNAVALLEDFDFTMCQFVLAGRVIHVGHMAITDAENKNLVVADTKAPVAVIRRIMKYKAEGFRISDTEIKTLLRNVVKNPDSIDRELVVADYVRESAAPMPADMLEVLRAS